MGAGAVEELSYTGTPEMLRRGGATLVDPHQFQRVQNAVCRIRTSTGLGTGFVVDGGRILTNNHVVSTPAECDQSKAEFELGEGRVVTIDLDGSFFVTSDAVASRADRSAVDGVDDDHLDYALVGCKPTAAVAGIFRNPISIFEWKSGKPGEVWIVGHPDGGLKRVSMGGNRVQSIDSHKMRYDTETSPGSSGSPVLGVCRNQLRCFALHHMGTPKFNQGVCMQAIIADILRQRTPRLLHSWSPVGVGRWQLFTWYVLQSNGGSLEDGLATLKTEARGGNRQAQWLLSLCYSEGVGVAQDQSKAVRWLRRLAHDGNRCRQYELGLCYEGGLGVAVDQMVAAMWFSRAARLGNDDAETHLQGKLQRAQAAADGGDAAAQTFVGFCHHRGFGHKQDEKEGVEWLRKAVARRHAPAEHLLGQCYHLGAGVDQDDAAGVALLKRAVAQDDAPACFTLGACYTWGGLGVDQDDAEAVRLYRKGAAQLDPNCEFNLAHHLFNGKAVAKDVAAAERYYRRAALQGNVNALFEMGLLVEGGLTQAASWFREAAELGHDEAQHVLGQSLLYGDGVPKDVDEAEEWLRRSANQGNTEAQVDMGRLINYGFETIAQDREAAVNWFQVAASAGDAEGQYGFGCALSGGFGIRQDKVEAARWWKKAAKQGHADAQLNLGVNVAYGKNGVPDEREGQRWLGMAAQQSPLSPRVRIAQATGVARVIVHAPGHAFRWLRGSGT